MDAQYSQPSRSRTQAYSVPSGMLQPLTTGSIQSPAPLAQPAATPSGCVQPVPLAHPSLLIHPTISPLPPSIPLAPFDPFGLDASPGQVDSASLDESQPPSSLAQTPDRPLIWDHTHPMIQEPFWPPINPTERETHGQRLHSAQAHLTAFGDQLYAAAYRSRNSSSQASSGIMGSNPNLSAPSPGSITRSNSNLSVPPSHLASLNLKPYRDASFFSGSAGFANDLEEVINAGLDPKLITSYNRDIQEIVKTARSIVLYSMVTEMGWPVAGNFTNNSCDSTSLMIWKDTFREAFQEACLIHSKDQDLTLGMAQILLKGTNNLRSVLGSQAKKHSSAFFTPHDSIRSNPQQFSDWKIQELLRITRPENAKAYFMHEHDSQGRVIPGRWFANDTLERFHIDFWYTNTHSPFLQHPHNIRTTPPHMYAYSATALLCALEREAYQGTGKDIKFEAKEYALAYQDIYDSLVDNLQDQSAISAGLRTRLQALHAIGMERLSGQSLPLPSSSRKRLGKAFVPSAEQLMQYESQRYAGAGLSSCVATQGQPQIAQASTSTAAVTSAYREFPVMVQPGAPASLSALQPGESSWASNYLDGSNRLSRLFD